jgi:hypothetical protein
MAKIKVVDVGALAACIAAQKGDRSLVSLCTAHGLPRTDAPTLSRILRGEPVSDATLKRIGRSLGCVDPPRRVLRRAMSQAQAQAWDIMSQAERNQRLGIES